MLRTIRKQDNTQKQNPVPRLAGVAEGRGWAALAQTKNIPQTQLLAGQGRVSNLSGHSRDGFQSPEGPEGITIWDHYEKSIEMKKR